MIDVISVTKKYGDFTAIKDLSFHVEKASIYGLVGYNGAGKTTLLKTMAGVFKADSGEVRMFGDNVFDNPAVKQRVFYVPDDLYFKFNASMERMAKFYRNYYPKFSMSTFDKLSELFGLDKTKKINGFSKGMQRQAEMVLGMSTLPDILLLDESFDGLDPAKRNMAKKLLLEYMVEKGCSIVVSSHNLHELADICDHIGLINGQRIVIDCSVDEMSGSRCKFRVIFDRDVEQSEFEGINIKRFSKEGKIINLTAEGDNDTVEEKLRSMSPLLVEKFPLSLEEIFLEEMEDTEYDLTKIFE
ncbi:MAG: ABC transporter ATP-binding protein [Clostridiales bacterium]|jgi:ABC-2 type transport system ATP-binding protein|nr:ABC transporter ATP-binding protein [Clostridiales bacterium]